jgi:hypothetical protein
MFKFRLHFCFAPLLSTKAARILICGATLALATDAAHAQQRLVGQPVTASSSAVVNFQEAAWRDAIKPRVTGPLIPLLIPDSEPPPEPYFAPASDWSAQNIPSLSNLPRPLVPSPSTSQDFAGLDDIPITGTSFIVIPPDTDGAVGLTKVMSGLNNNYRIFDKASGSVLSTVSPDTFWTGIGATGPFDPKTLYDPFNDRWIVVMVSDAQAANASILIGVSQTSDPSGAYFLFRVDVDSTNMQWADFPTVGFNKNWVSVNVNMIRISNGAFVSGKQLVVDYPSLRAGTFSGVFFTGTGFVASPCATYSSSEATLYVPTHLSSAGATYELDTITGTPGSPTYTLGTTKTRTGGAWTQPTGQILPQAAPLSGSSACGATPCKLETQDAQIRGTPVFRDSFIYYAQTIGLPSGGTLTRTAAQWTKIDPSGNFVDGGRVDDPTATATNGGKWYAYPHIAVNNPGDILLAFSQFSSAQYPSAGYTFHDRADAAGTMRDPFIYKTGEDYYHKTFSGTRNRWGDYSKAQVDPSNDLDLWTVQEYAKTRVGTDDGNTGTNSSRWATWWGRLGLPPLLQLTAAVSRKNHGTGTFDIDLLNANFGPECRSSGGNHTFVFTFTNNVTSGSASVTTGTGSVSGSPTFSANTMTVNLTGVTDVQKITVTLSGVTDSFSHVLPNTAVSANMLIGDTTGNKSVNSSDISQTKAQSGQAAGAGNFRTDVTVSGLINSSDISLVKASSGHAVP